MCMTNRQYDNRLRKLSELEAQKKELEEQIKALQEEIKSDMGDTEEIDTGKWIVRWTKSISNRFDTTAFKKSHKKLYDEFCKASESRRFSYKAIA